MIKKQLSAILVSMLLLLSCMGVYADEMYTVVSKPITVTYNGEDIIFPDALPQIQNGRTLVPVRAIMERAQMQVDYDAATRTVTAQKEDLQITMPIDDTAVSLKQGDAVQTITLDAPARLIDDRTYVPVRFIAESLGTKVNWNAAGREVVIIDTDEWAKQIEDNSALMNLLLHQSFSSREAMASTTGADLAFSYALQNVKDENGKPIQLDFDIKMTLAGTAVYDGTNTGSYISLETDLSFLKQLLDEFENEDAAFLKKFAKPYSFDLEIIVDKDWNLYCKSKALVTILKDCEQTAAAELIGDHYIRISMAELLSIMLPIDSEALALATEGADSIWAVLENLVETDDMLYTQSVAQLDFWVDLYASLYHDKQFKVTKQRDGSELWHYQLDKETYLDAALNLVNESLKQRGAPEEEVEIVLEARKEAFSAMDYDLTMDLTMKNGIPTKVEYSYSMDMDIPVDLEGGTMTMRLNGKFSTADRAFNAKKDKKVVVPTDTVDLADVLGVNQLVILPEA